MRKAPEEQRTCGAVFLENYSLTATDVSGLLLRMADTKPDIVLTLIFGTDSYIAIPQMKELKISPRVLITTGLGASTRDLYTGFNNAAREGMICWTTATRI